MFTLACGDVIWLPDLAPVARNRIQMARKKVDFSLIRLVSGDESYRDFSYRAMKEAEGKYITQMFGWDEEIQRHVFSEAWQRKKPDIITYDGKPIGTIATIETEDCIEIALFFILPEYENKGIGRLLLRRILDKADRTGRASRLKFLTNNPAGSLYIRNGFRIVSSDDNFHYAERSARFGVGNPLGPEPQLSKSHRVVE